MLKQALGCSVALLAAAVAATSSLGAQAPAAIAATYNVQSSYTPPKTPWGHPDLQGTYTNKDENGVALERPNGRPAQEQLSEQEFHEIVAERLERARKNAPRIGGTAEDETGAGPAHWYESLDAQNHELWLITNPADGKMPPLTADGQKRVAAIRARRGRVLQTAADHSLYDRCITRGVVGSMLPVIYGNSYQIVQSPDSVAIRYEMIHETRVIPLDGRAHASAGVRSLMGDARGHWDGNTLVVETTNFTDRTSIGVNGGGTPNSTALTLTERFTPVDGRMLKWEVTVNDPQTWTRPWTFALPLTKDSTQEVFEYACHEGNYAMRNMLSAVQKEAADKAGTNEKK
jgi:hypothetical protein